MIIHSVHPIEIIECPRCFSRMHKSILSFHLTRCMG